MADIKITTPNEKGEGSFSKQIYVKLVGFQELLNKFPQLGPQMFEAADATLAEQVNLLRTYILESMQNTPRAPHFYHRGKRKHFPSLPGNPPARDYGGLMTSIIMFVNKEAHEVELGSTILKPPYPFYLEQGTKRMKPRPWMEPAVEAHEATIIKNVIEATKQVIRNNGGNPE